MTQVDSQVVLDRPGTAGSQNTLLAAGADFQRAFESYQGTADVTSIVQKLGSGAYRLTGAAKTNAVDRDSDNNYVGWGLVIVYKRDSERLRSVSVWDGLTFVTVGLPSNFTVRGFCRSDGGAGRFKAWRHRLRDRSRQDRRHPCRSRARDFPTAKPDQI